MGCACKNKGNRERYDVVLKGGTRVTKTTEAAALAFSAKHPGSKVVKAGATAS